MLTNYFKITFRTLHRNKVYSFINIIGLAVGIATVLINTLFILEEMQYDDFHENKDRIYRVVKESRSAYTQPVFATTIKNLLPEIEQVARLDRYYQDFNVIKVDNELQQVSPFYFADPEIFNILTIPTKYGNLQTAFSDSRSVVISSSAARQYFGESNAVGETLTIKFDTAFYDMRVTAVMDELPENSLLNPEMLLPMSLMKETASEDWAKSWGFNSVSTLVLLRDGADPLQVEEKLAELLVGKTPEYLDDTYLLQPLSLVHLHSEGLQTRGGVYGNASILYLYTSIAIAILLIACANFVNLSLAQGIKRVKEVGIRKIVGARRSNLMAQSIIEYLVVTILSLPFAFIAMQLLVPMANDMMGRSMDLSPTSNYKFYIAMAGITLAIGVVCGGVISLFLSRGRAASLVKGGSHNGAARSWLNRGMIVFQFITFCSLMVASLVIVRQVDYMKNTHPGFNKEQVVVLRIPSSDQNQSFEQYKRRLMAEASIKNVSVTSSVPPWFGNWLSTGVQNGVENQLQVDFIVADPDYRSTLEIPLLKGTDFQQGERRILLNEKGFSQLFPNQQFQAASMSVSIGDDIIPVAGIIQNFQPHTFHSAIKPLAIMPRDENMRDFISYLAIRLEAGSIPQGLEVLESTWKQIYPEDIFDYRFLDEALDQSYKKEQTFAQLILFFTTLAILLACLGLFGMAAYASEQRTKEIGIRKVLGASVSNIVAMLSKDFVLLVVIGFVIAIPIAWYAMNSWLADFAYRIEIGPGIFVIAGVSALVIALLTVSGQAIKAAIANPVESLKNE